MSLKANFNKKVLLYLMDTFIFFGSLFLALYIRRPDVFEVGYFVDHIPRFSPLYIYFIISFFVAGLYEVPQFSLKIKKIKYILYIIVSYIIFGTSYFYMLPSEFSPKTVLIVQAALLFFIIVLWRIYSNTILKSGKNVKALILDKTTESEELSRELFKNDYCIEIAQHIDFDSFDMKKDPRQALIDTVRSNKIEMIIADIKNEKLLTLLPHIYTLTGAGVKLYDLKNIYQYVFKKMPLSSVGYFWFYENISLDTKVYEFVKRIIDLILCVPVFILMALLHPWVMRKIKQEDGGDIFSVQERLGRYNKTIFIKKYRTMSFTDKGEWLEKSQNKVTEIGKFLRKTRIDELPQIFSVWRGDLSFIGPRTDIVNLGDKLSKEVPYYNLRYSVTPGLSGWAQTQQHEAPKFGIDIKQTKTKLAYDMYYLEHSNLMTDLAIMLRTLKVLVSKSGI